MRLYYPGEIIPLSFSFLKEKYIYILQYRLVGSQILFINYTFMHESQFFVKSYFHILEVTLKYKYFITNLKFLQFPKKLYYIYKYTTKHKYFSVYINTIRTYASYTPNQYEQRLLLMYYRGCWHMYWP